VRVVLISTYELGRQPFGLASPAAWLRAAGHQVTCADLSRDSAPLAAIGEAELIAFYLPMHTATRLALPVIDRVRALNPAAQLCAYGLYAPMNDALLRARGVRDILGGEFEQGLADLAGGAAAVHPSTGRQRFVTPDRSGLPELQRYVTLQGRTTGYTEASRGCKHLCRHCPVVPVYNGVFRIVQQDVVLADIRQQVAAGAEHITFGDPDFFNGPGHATAVVEALHRDFPALTYDVTIKVEHLLKQRGLLPALRRTGCLFVTSAVESLDDAVLDRLDKGHTRAHFFELVRLMREHGLTLSPTFLAFTPWTTRASYRDLLAAIADLELIPNVAPIQLAIRLLIPSGSRLMELEEIRRMVGPFDPLALSYRWRHEDPSMDRLCADLHALIQREEKAGSSRPQMFAKIWEAASGKPLPDYHLTARAAIPYLNEPWYC
jgi:hypothetical protein